MERETPLSVIFYFLLHGIWKGACSGMVEVIAVRGA